MKKLLSTYDKIQPYVGIQGELKKLWTILEDDFKSSIEAKSLPDIDLFRLGESYGEKANAYGYALSENINDNLIYGGEVYYTFDYRFGTNSNSSFIYSVYSGYGTNFGVTKN